MEVTVNFFEYKVTGLNSDSLLYLFQEIFLSREYYFDCDIKSPKIIDCGANVGISILYFKRLFPSAEIIGIEPNPTAFRVLQKNIFDNKLKGVSLLNCCLSDHEGKERFYVEKIGTSNLSGSIFESRGSLFEVEVDAIKLSSIVGTGKFNLIKIDVEGAERQIFKDLVESDLLTCSEKYLLEYHHHQKMDNLFTTILDTFESKGYRYNLRAGFKNMGSFQDVVIAFFN
jgi:FkbM family methyltransferase